MKRDRVERSATKWLVLFLAVAVLTVGVCTGARATTITFNYDFEFSGATPPAGPGPWLTATFADVIGGVQLTMAAPGLTGSEYVSGWYFNFDPTLVPANLDISFSGGQAASAIGQEADKFKADGDGMYDILLDFPTSGDKFTAGKFSSYMITGASASLFSFKSLPAGGHGPFYAAAHVQSIGSESGWLAGSLAPVPEPGTLLLLGSALVGLGTVARRQRRK